ncbi:MAG: hypothetical protein GQ574_00125 [Crocinitomix sp.]|nr:hypothetical protein [Crocinitomix sp.]
MSNTIRLQNILEKAVNNVPFYKGMHPKGTALSLNDFPIVDKSAMINNRLGFISEIYHEAYQSIIDENGDCDLIVEYTSGSSGYPLLCVKSKKEATKYALSLLRKRKHIYRNYTLDNMFCFIHNRDYESNGYQNGLGNLNNSNILKVLIYLRDEVKPTVLHGNPMLLIYYAKYIHEFGFDLKKWSIEFIESVSESISESDKALVEKSFNTKLINCYGCLECYNLAYECEKGQLHINENVIAEVVSVDNANQAMAAGETGEILITSLVNEIQPIIRYKTSDIGFISNSCDCGNKQPVISLSGTRKIDYINLLLGQKDAQDVTICGYDIFSAAMNNLVKQGKDYVKWYNVIQHNYTDFEVLYVANEGFSPSFFTEYELAVSSEIGYPIKLSYKLKTIEDAIYRNKKERVFKSIM